MKSAILILDGFAGLWAISGLLALRSPVWMWAIPICIAVAVAAWCLRKPGNATLRSQEDRRRIKRLVGLWSAVEIVVIVGVANAMAMAGWTKDVAPAAVIIVGLHFLPLARGIPQGEYYGAGVALICVGFVALALPTLLASLVVGFGAASVLWLTSIAMSAARRRDLGGGAIGQSRT